MNAKFGISWVFDEHSKRADGYSASVEVPPHNTGSGATFLTHEPPIKQLRSQSAVLPPCSSTPKLTLPPHTGRLTVSRSIRVQSKICRSGYPLVVSDARRKNYFHMCFAAVLFHFGMSLHKHHYSCGACKVNPTTLS